MGLDKTITATCMQDTKTVSCYSEMIVGTEVTIECKDGYIMPVSRNILKIKCLENGNWNKNPFECEPEKISKKAQS